ncbi:aspartate/glutamate racemase family protein [Sulfitobacter sp. D35]|uniref:maleate cis-trans isomerase family protein n=1 Tax=Sulfitobacter sp. D35 TaxID=3083252 RepID=UPI00296EEBD7|nr:aspartate/glutamate racemase family protein [Sulfitobacter sp. D35]MDW4497970.1 aspartate/glutamate racemase family protein [Sulfitobacter sp. D35]
MTRQPYTLTGPIGVHGTLGLIVLQVDETIEQEFRRFFPQEVALHVSRIPSGADLTPETIAEMEHTLPQAARLLPPAAEFGAVAYACTSGTTLIGARKVAVLVSEATGARAVTDPLSAAFAGLRALDVSSVAIVSPYVATVATPIRRAFERTGFSVPEALSFGEKVEARVARIDPASVRDAARVAARSGAEAIFLSCTNLRTLDVIDDLEAELDRPVLSSNQVLAWHMARLADAPLAEDAPGRLMRLPA